MLAAFSLCAVVSHAGGLQLGRTAPKLDTELTDGRILFSRQLEGKVVLQYFWATWCPICRGELPQLQKLYEAYQPRGLEIIAQSLDDDPSAVLEFWRKGGYTFPVAMRSDETRAGFGPIKGTPTLFLIDRRGTVRLRRVGTLPDGALEAQIKALLMLQTQNGHVTLILVPDQLFASRVVVSDRNLRAVAAPTRSGSYILIAESSSTLKRIEAMLM